MDSERRRMAFGARRGKPSVNRIIFLPQTLFKGIELAGRIMNRITERKAPGRFATKGISVLRDCSGFTLGEVLIAAFILAVVLSAILLTLNMSQRSSEMALRRTVAMHGARSQVETLTANLYDGATLQPGGWINYTGGRYRITAVDARTRNIQVEGRWVTPFTQQTNTVVLTTSISETLHK
jgi:type II secretory pathway pseudopilin PulG